MEDEMHLETELDCPTERAWQALTEPSELSKWLGGEVEIEVVPGGELSVEEPDGTRRSGFVEKVEPGRGLSFWWSEEGAAETGRVEIEILPGEERDRCRLSVTESRPLAGLELELAEITGPTMIAA